MPNYFYDTNHVRYELYQTNSGKAYNWLFLSGGPGADSSYFQSLVEQLNLPGNVWLIDLPGNGSHAVSADFDQWMKIFPDVVKRFDNPIIVGHSFGGMFPLLFPELEEILKGFVILNSAPSLWLEEAVAYSKQFDLPDLTDEMQAFTQNPSQETFEVALAACMPYYFSPATLEKGRELLMGIPFQYLPAVWWQKKAIELNFSAKWIPQEVPTLIVSSKFDCICPYTLFEKDQRFQRSNIDTLFLENAGHIPWMESPAMLNDGFDKFTSRLEGKPTFAAIYRGYVKPEREKDYIAHWKVVASYFIKERGALGSTLHKVGDGMWVAYSRWPSKEMRDASWPAEGEEINSTFPNYVCEAIKKLKACVDPERPIPEIAMSVVETIHS